MIPGAEDPTFDAILGMTFCKQTIRIPSVCQFAELRPRSCALISIVYLLLDFGDFIDDTASARTLHILNFSLHNEPRRSSHRLCGDAAERAGHDEFTALQYGIGEHRFFPEVQNPDLRGGDGRIGAEVRCVSCGSTAQARVPPAVRLCSLGRRASAAYHGVLRPSAIF